jgi:hypothetical protein
VESKTTFPRAMIVLTTALFTLIVVFHLGSALSGKSLFRAIHLGTALEFGRRGVDLAHPKIVGFNATDTATAEELPLWQAMAGLVFKATGALWYGWANLVSLMVFATGLWPFFQLARVYTSERVAWWAVAFLLAEPLIVLMAGFGSTDGFCLTVNLWFLWFADRMIRSNRLVWWLPAAAFAAISAVSKAPFFMAAGLCSISLLLLNGVRDARRWLLLAGTGLAAMAAFLAWTHHTDALASQAVYPYYELRLSRSPQIFYWYFGDLHTRLNPRLWLAGSWRFLHATVGALPLTVLLLAGLAGPGNRLAKLWLLGTLATTLVFTHVILIHWHYYLMCCPGVALLCGATLSKWDELWAQATPQRWLRIGLVGIALALSAVDGVITTKVSIYFDSFPREMADLIGRHTKPSDKLVVYGGDWGGEELFRSGRSGFYVYGLHDAPGVPTMRGLTELLGTEADLARLKGLGYNKLVLISESPVRFAVVAGNPGSRRKRFYYPETISPAVDAWPTLYRSEDLLIKEIP